MPRAKLDELSGFRTTSQVAGLLGLSSYLIKARIADGLLPPASRISDAGVLLFDDDWLSRAREAVTQSTPRRRRQSATPAIASPATWFGHELGESQWLPDWGEVHGYFAMLAEASSRVELEIAGVSTSGNPYLVVHVSSEANLRPENRRQTRDMLHRLWDGRDDPAPPEVVDQTRTVGFILASQHSTEIGSLLMTMQLAWELAVASDADALQILDETITVMIPSHNPDGIQMITEWYRQSLGEPWEGTWMPWLYHPFVGHDNNRDWFMQTQAETQLFVALHNREHPQAVFDMHQMGRFGPRFMVPPFIDPLDPNQDPLVQQGFAALGTHIAQRMTAAGQAGVVTNAIFDNYSPSLAYGNYHGSVDLLSEAASVKLATPVTLKESDLNADYGIDPRVRAWNQPLVWEAGEWTLKDIVAYDLVAARAFLEHLSRNRRQWLSDYRALNARTSKRERKPYAFVIPATGRDPRATAELLDILQRGLVDIHRAGAEVVIDGVRYPAGTWVVKLDQPGGAFAKTLLEVQRYPELRVHPDGPLRPPYDISGHTLPIQMGVPCFQVDTPLAPDVALERVTDPIHFRGSVSDEEPEGDWWLISATSNAVIGALAGFERAEVPVFRARGGVGAVQGDVLVRKSDVDTATLEEIVTRVGAVARSRTAGSVVPGWRQEPVRIGVYQSWTACIDEGWLRWILEDYGLPYLTLHNIDIRQGGLGERIDVLILPEMSATAYRDGLPEKNREGDPNPPEYLGRLGDVGIAALREFVKGGGTLITCDGSAEYAVDALALPVENVLEGVKDFSCPGSLLQVIIDPGHPLGFGLPRELATLFLNSRVFRGTAPEATMIARYPQTSPLLSGWISGDERIRGAAALVDVTYGRGTVVLFGFRPWFRAQTRGTYRVLFNAIYRHGLSELLD